MNFDLDFDDDLEESAASESDSHLEDFVDENTPIGRYRKNSTPPIDIDDPDDNDLDFGELELRKHSQHWSSFRQRVGSVTSAKPPSQYEKLTDRPVDRQFAKLTKTKMEIPETRDMTEEEWDQFREERRQAVLNEILLQMVGRFRSLVETGAMPGVTMDEIADTRSSDQLLTIMRQNRSLVSQQLERRLFTKQRPTKKQLEQRGIVPLGYFTSHDKALKKKHRRRSSTVGDMENLLKLRPKPEKLVERGLIKQDELEQVYELDAVALEEHKREDDDEKKGPYEISLLRSLLFLTIQEALKKSCIDCQKAEKQILHEMEEITQNLKGLRDQLDGYDLSNILEFEKDEELVREKFRQLQTQLLGIGARQQSIHQKLTILHGVERGLIALQNDYDKKLGRLRRAEQHILETLKQSKAARNKAVKIMYAERSHQNWAMAKLNFTIGVSKQHNIYVKKRIDGRESDSKEREEEFSRDAEFTQKLENFLQNLRDLSEHQNTIVHEFQTSIEGLESDLLSIRHEMAKVRTHTFKCIYELHRNVEIADTLDLGFRRLSVANATEIERERRHHATKIQRQLNTLQCQLEEINVPEFASKLNEINDVQTVMSDSKLKAFFTVFVQVFSQTLIDAELAYDQYRLDKVPAATAKFLQDMYGIRQVLLPLSAKTDLQTKLALVMRFVRILKGALLEEECKIAAEVATRMGVDMTDTTREQMKMSIRIETCTLDTFGVFIARKLCTDIHMMDEIDKTVDLEQISSLAQMRVRDVFETICDTRRIIFTKHPRSIADASEAILKSVWDINLVIESI